MKITIVTVGKKHDKNLNDAIVEYEKRLKPYCDFAWHFVPNSDLSGESEGILSAVKGVEFVVLMDENGLSFTNSELADSIERAQNSSIKKIAIIIGGSYGVHRDVAERANVTLSLSKLVFPHQIVRLIVIEQIYRSYTILADGNYHHA